MRAGRFLFGASIAVLAGLAAERSFGADPTTAGVPPAKAGADAGIAVAGRSRPETVVTAREIAALPVVRLALSYETEHGVHQATFEGPLLWTVLDHAGAVDATKPPEQVRQTVLISGQDGYTAVLALGEIAPAFEGKQVILAERMDGRSLGPEHFRVVVPGDRRGSRGVHDVVRMTVTAPEPVQR